MSECVSVVPGQEKRGHDKCIVLIRDPERNRLKLKLHTHEFLHYIF